MVEEDLVQRYAVMAIGLLLSVCTLLTVAVAHEVLGGDAAVAIFAVTVALLGAGLVHYRSRARQSRQR